MPSPFYNYDEWMRQQGMVPPVPEPIAPPVPEPIMPPDLGLPEAPAYDYPELLTSPAPDFRTRLAYSLADFPQFHPHPFESGGSQLGRGLISGLASGFSTTGLLKEQRQQEGRKAENVRRLTEADRNYANRKATWEAQVSDYYRLKKDREGKVVVNAKLADAMGHPEYEGKPLTASEVDSILSRRAEERASGRTMTETERHNRAMEAKGGGGMLGYGTPQELDEQADGVLNGVASGYLNPQLELYAPVRSPLRTRLATRAVERGIDVGTLQQNWNANKRGIATANSPQQLRMRQAARTISGLLDQIAGPADPKTGIRRGGIVEQLQNSGIPMVNWATQAGAKSVGSRRAGIVRSYNIAIRKLAGEQAFLIVGGNDPPTGLMEELANQYQVTDSPKVLREALRAVEETAKPYETAIGEIGPVTPSYPYQPGQLQQNPIGGPNFRLGLNPAQGTTAPAAVSSPRVRVLGPNGETGTVEQGDALPPGWKVVK